MRLAWRAAWLSLLSLLFTATQASETLQLTGTDGAVTEIQAPVQRIVTLAPHLTELVYAVGAGDQIVATIAYSDYPEQAKQIPRVGDAFRVDLEQLLAMNPDLVILWESGNPDALARQLRDLGLSVWVTEIGQLDDIPVMLRQIGDLSGHSAAGEQQAAAFETRLDSIRQQYRDRTELSYFYQISEAPLYTVNGRHLISDGLSACGARNVFAGLTTLAPVVDAESVLNENPDILFAPAGSSFSGGLARWLKWPRLKAVRAGQLYYLSGEKISRASPRVLDAVEQACDFIDSARQRRTVNDE